MNETSEATHYQIELTSRQVLAALAVLLVCMFAAFFAGVWIGRNAEAENAAQELASVGEVGRGGERFDFFGKTAPPADGPEAAAAPEIAAELDRAATPIDTSDLDAAPPAPAAPEDLFADDPEALANDGELEPPEEMERGGRRRRAGARGELDTATLEDRDAPALDATPATAQAETAAAARQPATSPATGADDGFFIQVLATTEREKADSLIERLVDADFKAFMVPSNEGGRTIYRVRVGPFRDRAIAVKQADELETRWKLDSWISPGAP